jgi:sugar lactone lactonase YvrE
MRPFIAITCVLTAALAATGTNAQAQGQPPAQPPAEPKPFVAGQPLQVTGNVKIYGSFRFTESCSYDAERNLIVTPSNGVNEDVQANDGYVSLLNPDGTVHTPKWIGVNRDGLILNDPRGSDIENGLLYIADRDTIRWFDMATGVPKGSKTVEGAASFNDLEAAKDGTVYATQTGNNDGTVPWRIYKVTADGNASIFVEGAPLNRPNGIAFDPDGNIVVVQLGNDQVLTFSADGKLVKSETTIDPGNDGLVILADGTKYISSVQRGRIARMKPGQPAEEIASGVPSPASICLDPVRNQLILPMNNNNAVGFLQLE